MAIPFDCCDHEDIGRIVNPTGYSGDEIRDLMLERVEKRFGDADNLGVEAQRNGPAYMAEQKHLFAR